MARYLIVAHQTSESAEFTEAVTDLVVGDPDAEIVLVVPATPVKHLTTWTEGEARALASKKGTAARARLESLGVNVVDMWVGDANPYVASIDALAKGGFAGLLVSTFPARISRWLGMDVITRLERDIDIPVIHVVAH